MLRTYLDTTFGWRRGYSVLTFGKRNQPFVVRYIEKQKEHHQINTVESCPEYLVDESLPLNKPRG
ncbi:MAG: hypothetical protein Q9P44_22010 [Anaerolineae bacterium]|nr:hypothetical protein [Anaerolineae bacterium]